MKKPYIIEEFYPAEGDQRFSLTAENPLDQVSYTVFSADDFTDAAIYDYGERVCFFPETNTPLASFYARFARWKAQRGADIAAAYSVLRKSYNPLENYNMVENHTGTETGLKTPEDWIKESIQTPTNWKKATKQKPENWTDENIESYTDYKEKEVYKPVNRASVETETFENYKEREVQKPDGWSKSTTELQDDNGGVQQNKVVPFNGSSALLVSETSNEAKTKSTEAQSGTYTTDKTREGIKQLKKVEQGSEENESTKEGVISNKRTQSGTYTTEETQTGTYKVTDEQKGTFEDQMTYDTQLTRSGNIGTTTSQMMANSELNLRTKQFVKDVLKEFFDFVSVYC